MGRRSGPGGQLAPLPCWRSLAASPRSSSLVVLGAWGGADVSVAPCRLSTAMRPCGLEHARVVTLHLADATSACPGHDIWRSPSLPPWMWHGMGSGALGRIDRFAV